MVHTLTALGILQVFQVTPVSSQSTQQYILYNIILLVLWFGVFPWFYETFQLWRYQSQVSGFLNRLRVSMNNNITQVLDFITSKVNEDKKLIESRIRDLMEMVIIEPTSMEPEGLVRKYKALINSYNDRLEKDVSRLMPSISNSRPIIQNFTNVVDVLRELNFIYKVIDHYYRLAMKYKSYYLLIQLAAILPLLKEEIDALNGSVPAFLKGQPIGDSAGPLTVFRFKNLCSNLEPIGDSIKDTYIASCNFKGRKIYLVKAEGPGGTVGHLDDAIRYIYESINARPRLMITIDAALKLEGEESGSIAEGLGVAMGGIGVEKFNIESIATKYDTPIYAILIKMSMPEALNAMTKPIDEAVNKVVERLGKVIDSYSDPNDEVIIVGVGNTIGVAQ
ncbi:DUF1512 domain-containing protein [Caldivirga maquilingensis]|uniref:DUF1512 domain-containing protein n=1 Tax=Caldivirga maquilingensis TaxID=76887 RepID=UPI001E4A1FB0|nr:DUF1512 domain-containing protein [Caldivirga maquilingensis]